MRTGSPRTGQAKALSLGEMAYCEQFFQETRYCPTERAGGGRLLEKVAPELKYGGRPSTAANANFIVNRDAPKGPTSWPRREMRARSSGIRDHPELEVVRLPATRIALILPASGRPSESSFLTPRKFLAGPAPAAGAHAVGLARLEDR